MSSPPASSVFDLAVIGAGPGGSNAASVALRSGLNVVQLEKARFPRVKPCAGGLTVKGLKALDLGIDSTLRSSFRAFQFNLCDRRGNRFAHRRLLLRMVLRPEFDNDLVRQNRRRNGFRFLDGEPVRRIRYQDIFEIETPSRLIRAKQLVGADGAYSLVNRRFKISRPRGLATAVEVNLGRGVAESGEDCEIPCFDWGVIESGYGWVFPKDDHWSVGIYTLQRGLRGIRRQLDSYIRFKGFGVRGDPLATFQAYQLPIGGYRLSPPDSPLYLVGDAGGFADAVTGEGIYHALESGRLAGETAVEVHHGRGVPRRYYRRLWKSVLPDTFLTYRCAGLIYRRLDRSLRLLETPWCWRPLVQGFAAGATLTRSLLLSPYYWLASYAHAGRQPI